MNLQKTSAKFAKMEWIDIVHPNEEVLMGLKKQYAFHELDLEDCLSDIQRSKIDDYENYLFIVLHFPFFDTRRKRIVQEEVDIFIGQNFLLTIHEGRLKPLEKLMQSCKDNRRVLKDSLEKGSGYLLYVIIRELFDAGFPLTDEMYRAITVFEKDLFEGESERDMVRDILWLKKDIITFRRIISPQRAVVAQLEHKNKKFLPENLEVYFDDVVDKIEKIWNTLENLKELVEDLQDTNEVLISHQTNRVIKMLTVFSVVLLPLTVITGFYGMNVDLPFGDHAMAAAGITVSMLALVVSMILFFKWKRWL